MPVDDDQRLFEKICLEGFQAGLSWITILRKRESFRTAFGSFDFRKVARYPAEESGAFASTDSSIVRHRGKIESTINNAAASDGSGRGIRHAGNGSCGNSSRTSITGGAERENKSFPTPTSPTALSKELKRRGWSFVGPTTCYAMMQAMGMVNDHLKSCDRWLEEESTAPERFKRPGLRHNHLAHHGLRDLAGLGWLGRLTLGGGCIGERRLLEDHVIRYSRIPGAVSSSISRAWSRSRTDVIEALAGQVVRCSAGRRATSKARTLASTPTA